jgi:hypothetical protein
MSILSIEDGHRIWRNEAGQFHREEGPAIELTNGDKHWYFQGKLHREEGPAIELTNGYKEWFFHGNRHRINGPSAINFNYREWRIHDQLHREDGPAVEWSSGDKEWFFHGNRHRIDGPAIDCVYGPEIESENGTVIERVKGYTEWWVQGVQLSKQEFTNLLVQHHLKLRLLTRIIPPGSENLVDKYSL